MVRYMVLLAVAVWVSCGAGCVRPKRNLYLIPDGYAGWLGVAFGVEGAPELVMEDGYRVVRFPTNGFVETSSPGLPGKEYDDRYYYYRGSNRMPVNIAVELGGGGTVQKAADVGTGRYISRFWVSRNARDDWATYVKDQPVQYGPFRD